MIYPQKVVVEDWPGSKIIRSPTPNYVSCHDQNTCLGKVGAMVRKGLKIEELRMNPCEQNMKKQVWIGNEDTKKNR